MDLKSNERAPLGEDKAYQMQVHVEWNEETSEVVVFCDPCQSCSVVDAELLRMPGGTEIVKTAVGDLVSQHFSCTDRNKYLPGTGRV